MTLEQQLRTKKPGYILFVYGAQAGIALLAYSLFTLIDLFFVAKWVGDDAAGAISALSPIIILIGAISSTIGIGGSSIISRALGEKNLEKAAKTAGSLFSFYWITSLVITLLCLLLMNPILHLLSAEGNLYSYAKDYLTIIIIGLVASTGFSAFVRAEGASTYALLMWLIPIGMNVVLDILLIYQFQMGIKGAAIATIASEFLSLMMSLYFFFVRKNKSYHISFKHLIPNQNTIGKAMMIGLPTLINQFFFSIIIIAYNHILFNIYGENGVTALGYTVKIVTLFYLLVQGFVVGAQPLIAYTHQTNPKLMTNIFIESMGLTLMVAFVLYGFGLGIITPLLKIFTSNQAIIDISIPLFVILITGTIFGIFVYHLMYFFQSTGAEKKAFQFVLIVSTLIKSPLVIVALLLPNIPIVLITLFTMDFFSFIYSIILLNKKSTIPGGFKWTALPKQD